MAVSYVAGEEIERHGTTGEESGGLGPVRNGAASRGLS